MLNIVLSVKEFIPARTRYSMCRHLVDNSQIDVSVTFVHAFILREVRCKAHEATFIIISSVTKGFNPF